MHVIYKEGPKDDETEYRPTVLLDAGVGCWSLIYADLLDELSTAANVVAFDRFGYGYSSYKGKGNRVVDAANSLTQILQRLHLEGPYIYVAHSLSGTFANYYARKIPSKTKRKRHALQKTDVLTGNAASNAWFFLLRLLSSPVLSLLPGKKKPQPRRQEQGQDCWNHLPRCNEQTSRTVDAPNTAQRAQEAPGKLWVQIVELYRCAALNDVLWKVAAGEGISQRASE